MIHFNPLFLYPQHLVQVGIILYSTQLFWVNNSGLQVASLQNGPILASNSYPQWLLGQCLSVHFDACGLVALLIQFDTDVRRAQQLMSQELWDDVCSNVLGEECVRLLAHATESPDTLHTPNMPVESSVWALLHASCTMRATISRLLVHLLGPENPHEQCVSLSIYAI